MTFQVLWQELQVIFWVKFAKFKLFTSDVDVLGKHLLDRFITNEGFWIPIIMIKYEFNIWLRVIGEDWERRANIQQGLRDFFFGLDLKLDDLSIFTI